MHYFLLSMQKTYWVLNKWHILFTTYSYKFDLELNLVLCIKAYLSRNCIFLLMMIALILSIASLIQSPSYQESILDSTANHHQNTYLFSWHSSDVHYSFPWVLPSHLSIIITSEMGVGYVWLCVNCHFPISFGIYPRATKKTRNRSARHQKPSIIQ